MEKFLYIVLSPKNLARMVFVWFLATTLLSGFSVAAQTNKNTKTLKQITQEKKEEFRKIVLESAKNKKERVKEKTFEDVLKDFGIITNSHSYDLSEQIRFYPELPLKIKIDKINLNLKVVNPASTDIKVLDEKLKEGAVRYPESGFLGEPNKAIVIFGHTSYVPGYYGYYRYFNDVKNLKEGDKITLFGENREYVYKVVSKKKVKVKDAEISINSQKNKLYLVTCDGFGGKADRWVIEAELEEIYQNVK